MQHRQFRSQLSRSAQADNSPTFSSSPSSKINRVRPLALVTSFALVLFALPAASNRLTGPFSQRQQKYPTKYASKTSQLSDSNAHLPPPPTFSRRSRLQTPTFGSLSDYDSQEWEDEGDFSEQQLSSIDRYDTLQTSPKPSTPRMYKPGTFPKRTTTIITTALPTENPRDVLLWNGRHRGGPLLPHRRHFKPRTLSLPSIPEHAPVNAGLPRQRRNTEIPGSYLFPPTSSGNRNTANYPATPSLPKLTNAVDPSKIPQIVNERSRSERHSFRRHDPYIHHSFTFSTQDNVTPQDSAGQKHPPPMKRFGNYLKNLAHKAAKTISAGRAMLPRRLRLSSTPKKQVDPDQYYK